MRMNLLLNLVLDLTVNEAIPPSLKQNKEIQDIVAKAYVYAKLVPTCDTVEGCEVLMFKAEELYKQLVDTIKQLQ